MLNLRKRHAVALYERGLPVRVLVVDHTSPGHLSLTDVPTPRPAAHEALVRVEAVSLNFGEVHEAPRPEMPDGTMLGEAVQLAARAGAHVVAISRSSAQADGLRALGAHEVHPEPAAVQQPVSAVLDNVGGQYLVDAFASLSAGGGLISVGRLSEADAVLPPDALLGNGGRHDRSTRTSFSSATPPPISPRI
jgi:NADPH:quinone reductase-like Zn-dependent oxidoreductase